MIKFEKNGRTYSKGQIKKLYKHVSLPNDTSKWMSFLEKEGFSIAPEPVKPVNDVKTTEIAAAKAELMQIDFKSVRPLREKDNDALKALNDEAILIRTNMVSKYGEDWYK